jgi:flagellar assembly factor FliW
LQFEDPNDVLVLTTLSLRDASAGSNGRPAMDDMYVNISAPILINAKTRVGMQKMPMARETRVDFHTDP